MDNQAKVRLNTLRFATADVPVSGESVYEDWALPVLAAWPKVLDVLDGKNPEPEVVELFPTNYCAHNCPHCRCRSEHGDSSQHISLDNLESLLLELQRRKVKRLQVSGGGEPLDHPYATEMFAMFDAMGFRVGLITNGYPLVTAPQLLGTVLNSTDWIRFSVDGFTSSTYKRVRGRSDLRYNKLQAVIKEVCSRESDKPHIGLKMLISRVNADDAILALPEALKLGVHYLQFKFLDVPDKLRLTEKELQSIDIALQQQINDHRNESINVEVIPPYSVKLGCDHCIATFLHPVIDWDGSIYLCAFFEHRKQQHCIGNINDGGLFEHWGSTSHRAAFDAIDPMICVPNCPMRRYNPLIEFMVLNDFRRGYI